MNRREWLSGAVSTLGVVGALGLDKQVFAEGKKKDPHAGHKVAAAAATDNPFAKAMAAAADCALKGDICIAHCQSLMAGGDTSVAGCLKTALEMVAACNAFVKLGSMQSKAAKKMAALCAELCHACEKACKEHEAHHQVCKDCMDSCIACARECEKVSA